MRTAIIGLPMTGKTSLFTILTGVQEATRLGSLETRVGVAKVPDTRLDELAKLFRPPKVTHAVVEYVDFPAISKEALREPSYLASLRVVDALAHVLRVFEDPTVPHEKETVDPVRDRDDVDTELILSDLAVVEKRLERLEKDRKKIKNPELDHEHELLTRCKQTLESNTPLRELVLNEEEEKRIRGFQFLSLKPMLYVLNLGEEHAATLHEVEQQYREKLGARPRTHLTAICGKIEAELAELPPQEAAELMASYGLQEPGLHRLITATYALLGLMSFLTAGETEVRAWTIPMNSTAVKAAGAIHSDFEKKFIRAEVVNWKSLIELGGYAGAREKGLLRLEGKDYIVKDGDVLVIRHG
ncbi:MAG: redox-regulated ATPase YchF [Bryobacteraceae bacterium]|nr:redox-regulated ATPase YchF [Bryobacteraceae bacterium]MDW8377220.1 redox-regulated ATPase YchF [Bryobacterales bacterium]